MVIHIKVSQDYEAVRFKKDVFFRRPKYFKKANVRIGEYTTIMDGVVIRPNVTISHHVFIGKNCHIGNNAFIRHHVDLYEDVKIGFSTVIEHHACLGKGTSTQGFCMVSEYSSIGKNVFLGPHFNNPADNTIGKPKGEYVAKPAVIEDDCRMGSGVIITPGRIIHKGSIIGAGSLVTKDTEPGGLYYGSPAKRVK